MANAQRKNSEGWLEQALDAADVYISRNSEWAKVATKSWTQSDLDDGSNEEAPDQVKRSGRSKTK